MPTDQELLRDYTEGKDETAFAEVVRRHTNLVYSVASRVTGKTHLAQDVAQTVFTKLAQRAERLRNYATLVGWLHTTIRHTAIDAIRRENHRQAREQEAFAMQEFPSTRKQIGHNFDRSWTRPSAGSANSTATPSSCDSFRACRTGKSAPCSA